MQRQAQIDVQPFVGEAADALGDARRGDGDVPHAQAPHLRLEEHAHGFDDVLVIEKRLAHAHEDDVVDVVPDVGLHGREMRDDLAGAEVALEALLPRGAKFAAQRTADLRGDAGRVMVAVVHQHRLDVLAVVEPPQVLARAVGGRLPLAQLRQPDLQQLGQTLAQRFGQIGHGPEVEDFLLVDPLAQLVGRVTRHVQLFLHETLPVGQRHLEGVPFRRFFGRVRHVQFVVFHCSFPFPFHESRALPPAAKRRPAFRLRKA